MAAGTLPKPGSKYGPCKPIGSCTHLDCAANVREATSPCRVCHRGIGYDTRYYREWVSDAPAGFDGPWLTNNDGALYVLVHAKCAEDEIVDQAVAARASV